MDASGTAGAHHTEYQQEVVVSENRITLVISPEQRDSAKGAVVQLASALPGLVSLPAGERRDIHHFGPKSQAFGRGIHRTLVAHPQIVPPSVDVAAAGADLDALDTLVPLLEEVRRLHSMLEDTVALLGHDVMDFAYEGYQLLKLTGDAHGLEEQRKELGSQFSRRRRAQDAGQTPPAA
jgi:hypothetical protein